MLSYNQEINSEINGNSVSVKEVAPIMKLNLRGKTREFFTNVGKSLNMILPTEANTSSSSDKLTAIWLSPDEWMIVSNETTSKETNTYQLNDILFNNISKKSLGAVTDVTDQFVQLEIKGDKIYELFSSGCPFNFNEFKKKIGSTTQTLLNNIDVILHNKDKNNVNLFVRRSFAEHLINWIEDFVSRI
ncbi:sarcosine oxidase subunit gamma [Candidatus Pelagibacter sp. HIMB1493]|uniref:sarcosine oxidase subunit gamma n=1 Tax=Candidatus Pelagibacter sp. HIMB1493 TaxID=3413334 RepID=UPI003F8693C1